MLLILLGEFHDKLGRLGGLVPRDALFPNAPSKIKVAIDPGMVRATTLDYENDLGRLFENVVYLDLRRLGHAVNYYLTSERYEIDFLAHTARGSKKLFQVAWDGQDAGTLAREERALQAAMRELKVEGTLITLDSYLREGIKWSENL